MVATKRRFDPNLQRVRVLLDGRAPARSLHPVLEGGESRKSALRPGYHPRMTERASVLELVRAAEFALERSRARMDDLNVFPVPDGDTGTNMLFTVRAVPEALEAGKPVSPTRRCSERAATPASSSRRSSAAPSRASARRVGRERSGAASDAAWAAVQKPVEGTILTAIGALADEAERAATGLPELLPRSSTR